MRNQESASGKGTYLGELTVTGKQLSEVFFARRGRDGAWRDLTVRRGAGGGVGVSGKGKGGSSGEDGPAPALTVQGRVMTAATATDTFIEKELAVEAIFRCAAPVSHRPLLQHTLSLLTLLPAPRHHDPFATHVHVLYCQ